MLFTHLLMVAQVEDFPVQAVTMDELCSRFLKEHSGVRNKFGTHYNYERLIIRFVLPSLGARKVCEIVREDIVKLHHRLRDTPYQANRLLGLLSKMMNMAEKWGYRSDGTNPTLHVEKYRESKRERYMTAEELGRLSTVLNEADETATEEPAVTAAIRLLIATGCRLSEILTLEWDWVDLAQRRLNLPESKTGAKTIHLNGLAIEILSGIERLSNNPYVLGLCLL